MTTANNTNEIALDAISPALGSIREDNSLPNRDVKQSDPFLVAFDEPYDVDNPQNWRNGRKWAITDVLSATGFNGTYIDLPCLLSNPIFAKIPIVFHN